MACEAKIGTCPPTGGDIGGGFEDIIPGGGIAGGIGGGGIITTCDIRCSNDNSCSGEKKCCSNGGCGNDCVNPISKWTDISYIS